MAQYLGTGIIALVLVAFVIYQQMRTRSIRTQQLIVLPVLLILVGASNVQSHPPASSAATVMLLTSVAAALVLGVARGVSTHVWRAGAAVLRRGTPLTLALWIVSLLVRLGVGLIARRAGVAAAVAAGEAPVFLGVTLAAQNVVIWLRAQDASPVAPR